MVDPVKSVISNGFYVNHRAKFGYCVSYRTGTLEAPAPWDIGLTPKGTRPTPHVLIWSLGWGGWPAHRTRLSLRCVTVPNLAVLCQMVRRSSRSIFQGHSRSSELTRIERISMTSSYHEEIAEGLSRTVSEIMCDFVWNLEMFSLPRVLNTPTDEVSRWVFVMALHAAQKS